MKSLARNSALALALIVGLGSVAGHAQRLFPGEGQTHDEVTGLLCVTPGCDFVRFDPPEARCICQKLNPTERRLSELRLECSTTEGMRWVQCPVQPIWGR